MGFKQRILDKKVKEELSIEGGKIVVDAVACDGCGTCVDVCPTDSLSMKTLNSEEVKQLPFKGRLKVRVKGANKAFVQNPEACIVCGKCVKECHEFAIHKVNN